MPASQPACGPVYPGIVTMPPYMLDFAAGTLTVSLPDGDEHQEPIPEGFLDFDTNVENVAIRPEAGVMIAGLPGGREATVELATVAPSVDELRGGRPVIYLNQNQWSRLSQWRRGDSTISTAEATAAEELVELVNGREVLLPVSAAHLIETVPLYGQRRVDLAATVLELSRGWQMLNPVTVRQEEIVRGLTGQTPVATEVFSPGAGTLFAAPPTEPDPSLPSSVRELAIETPPSHRALRRPCQR